MPLLNQPEPIPTALAGGLLLSGTTGGTPGGGAVPGNGEKGVGWPAGSMVLVVEDDPLICMNLTQMLEMMDLEAVGLGRAEQALEWLGSNPAPALMITDFTLPGMNGVALSVAARQRHPGLPILLATGHAESSLVLPPELEQGVGFLGKPYAMRHLEQALRTLWQASRHEA